MKIKVLSAGILIICIFLASCVQHEASSPMPSSSIQSQPIALSEPTPAPSVDTGQQKQNGIPNLPAISPLTDDEKSILASLRQVEGVPLYVMEYHGDYNPNGLASLNNAFNIAPACSTFAVKGTSDTIFARNHDFFDTSALLLYSKPTNGYASVSLVDLKHLGFEDGKNLTELPPEQLSKLLCAPFLPLDGMNECGLAVGTMTVPKASHSRENAPKIFFLTALREILDHAKNTEEAISILENYQLVFSVLPSHFLIADKSGDMAVIEFVGGKMQVLKSTANWHAATNFTLFDSEDIRNAYEKSGKKERNDLADDSIWRYTVLEDTLTKAADGLSFPDAMSLLKTVSTLQRSNIMNNTQWSVVYGLETGRGELVVHMDYDNPVNFQFDSETGLTVNP